MPELSRGDKRRMERRVPEQHPGFPADEPTGSWAARHQHHHRSVKKIKARGMNKVI